MKLNLSSLSPVKKSFVGLACVAVVLIALGTVKFIKISNAIAQQARFSPPPEAITSFTVKPIQWERTLSSVGTLTPSQGVTLSAEEDGKLVKIAFESGARVQAGELLVELDSALEEAKLKGAAATAERAREDLERAKTLKGKSVASQADLDKAQADYREAEAQLEWYKTAVERKKIYAPFAGRTGIRMVNVGDYLHAGDPVVPLHALDPLYLNFTLPQGDAGIVQTGEKVRIFFEGPTAAAEGKIHAVNPQIDEKTRNFEVQAEIPNPEEKLRPGMFARVEVVLPSIDSVIAIPASSINYAPYGDTVYVIEEMKDQSGKDYRGVRQQVVKLGERRGDQVMVVSGLSEGMTIVSSGVFKLRPGAAVTEHNELAPKNDPAPNPADS